MRPIVALASRVLSSTVHYRTPGGEHYIRTTSQVDSSQKNTKNMNTSDLEDSGKLLDTDGRSTRLAYGGPHQDAIEMDVFAALETGHRDDAKLKVLGDDGIGMQRDVEVFEDDRPKRMHR
ncbi:MAG: hypothetical protein Q9162_001357 [Coniocarpon cinnabarinum]